MFCKPNQTLKTLLVTKTSPRRLQDTVSLGTSRARASTHSWRPLALFEIDTVHGE